MSTYGNLIRETLEILKEESLILASPEDALYFRTTVKKEPLKKVVTPAPKPTPIPTLEIQTVIAKPVVAAPIVVTPAVVTPPPAPPIQTAWRNEQVGIQSEPINTSSIKALYQKLFPQMPIIQTIPSDITAKKIANRWKTKNQAAPISILYFSEPSSQKELLFAITKAIDIYFGPARLIHAENIETEKQWEAFLSSSELKLVIACDYTLWQLNDLMKYYQESPQRTLQNIPLFLLPDLSLYLKDPSLKRSLWKAIQNVHHRLS